MSSSAHLILLPRMFGWPYEWLAPVHRKAFEVAVHLGTAVGLGLALRREVAAGLRGVDLRRAGEALLALGPPAVVGAALGGAIEDRGSSPRAVAATQVMAGLAQAAALVPGVSRGGAVLTVGRLRHLSRPSAGRLARESAGPVIVAAACREVARLARGGVPGSLATTLAAGTAASFVSAAAAAPLAFALDRLPSWRAFGGYRVAFGLLALWRLRHAGGAAPPGASWHAGTAAVDAAPAASGSMGR